MSARQWRNLIDQLRSWLHEHRTAGSLVQEIMNLRNKATGNKSKSLEELVNAPANDLVSRFEDKLMSLLSCSVSMKVSMVAFDGFVNFLQLEDHDEGIPCDTSTLLPVLDRIKRQSELDVSVSEMVLAAGNITTSWTQHDMYTVIACFNYSPYVNLDEVELLVNSLSQLL